jgi:GntR family transcriptional regulator / MocR family aminotransferase
MNMAAMTGKPAGGADFLQLSPASAPARGLTTWLADALRAAIIDGRLQAGTALPATRVLAEDLGISRGVIVEVYQRLREEGLVSARRGAGTRVLPLNPPHVWQLPRTARPARARAAFTSFSRRRDPVGR